MKRREFLGTMGGLVAVASVANCAALPKTKEKEYDLFEVWSREHDGWYILRYYQKHGDTHAPMYITEHRMSPYKDAMCPYHILISPNCDAVLVNRGTFRKEKK